MKNLLIVVDYQNDFVNGSLGFSKAKDLEEHICNKIKKYRQNKDTILFTLDTHESDYPDTQEGKMLPVLHCIKNTNGIKLYGKVADMANESDVFIEKNTFGASRLGDYLKLHHFDSIELVGVVSNICVISNAVIAKTYLPQAEIIIDKTCVASNDDILNQKALDIMCSLQMKII